MTAIEKAALAGRLRQHARRARNDLGYRTPAGMARMAFAAYLRRETRKLVHASAPRDVKGMLDELDEVNP